jgi:hypothetical protein
MVSMILMWLMIPFPVFSGFAPIDTIITLKTSADCVVLNRIEKRIEIVLIVLKPVWCHYDLMLLIGRRSAFGRIVLKPVAHHYDLMALIGFRRFDRIIRRRSAIQPVTTRCIHCDRLRTITTDYNQLQRITTWSNQFQRGTTAAMDYNDCNARQRL